MPPKMREHYPELDVPTDPPVCAECHAEWPCEPVRVAWVIPGEFSPAEARDYLVNHLDGVA